MAQSTYDDQLIHELSHDFAIPESAPPTGKQKARPHDLSIEESLRHSPPGGVGLCLSGGGYRAMLFHLGGLWRLNEAGWLPRFDRIASVSGGSITAGMLGAAWPRLAFSAEGVSTTFEQEVAAPILRLATRTIDVPAVLLGLVTGGVSRRVEAAYDRHLYHGAKLADLPSRDPGQAHGPMFFLLATDLCNGVMWRFTREYMRSYLTPSVPNPDLPLARAIAASSAFPPFLSPVYVNLPDGTRITLSDGGVYDNLGLEPVLKNCATVLASDGGGPFDIQSRPHTDWLLGTVRVLLTIQAQVGRRRHAQLMAALASKPPRRQGALWTVETPPSKYPKPSPALAISDERAKALALTSTRLAKLPQSTCNGLVNWGYAAADAALRSYVDRDLPEPTGFPLPGGVSA